MGTEILWIVAGIIFVAYQWCKADHVTFVRFFCFMALMIGGGLLVHTVMDTLAGTDVYTPVSILLIVIWGAALLSYLKWAPLVIFRKATLREEAQRYAESVSPGNMELARFAASLGSFTTSLNGKQEAMSADAWYDIFAKGEFIHSEGEVRRRWKKQLVETIVADGGVAKTPYRSMRFREDEIALKVKEGFRKEPLDEEVVAVLRDYEFYKKYAHYDYKWARHLYEKAAYALTDPNSPFHWKTNPGAYGKLAECAKKEAYDRAVFAMVKKEIKNLYSHLY